MESLISYLGNVALLAQAPPAGDGGGGAGAALQPLLLFAVLGLLFYLMMIRPQRREQARRQEMLGNVKKNDRVVTIGGIYGVVTNVHREADEVTIKVDEGTNTKLRMTLSSIGRVLGAEDSEQPADRK